MESPLKVLLVEDDELFRLGLRVRLQQEAGFEVIAEAEDGETAIEMAKRHSLDVVILDIGLPGIGGIDACRRLRQLYSNLPILILTSHTQKVLINRIIEVGAQGYCLKGAPSETLILAIRSLAAGASWWDPNATSEIRSAFGDDSAAIPTTSSIISESSSDKIIPTLTQREQEILALIASGKTNQEIAEMLCIVPGTVRVHVHAILQKLGVRDRTKAAVMAIQRKLIAEDLLTEPKDP